MAYDRAPRLGPIGNLSTGPDVSPNTYNVSCNNTCFYGSNWTPFLSSSSRNHSTNKSSGPGPHAYNPVLNRKILGGTSLRNTARRFPNVTYNVPAGSKYDPYHISKECVDPEEPVPRLKGYLYHCRVPFTLFGYTPSVPYPRHRGYEISKDGILLKCCPSNQDTTLGPAFYHVNTKTFCSCYKGCYWSKHTAKARESVISDTPGVGTYSIVPEPNPLNDYLNKLRVEKKKNACNLRYIEQLQRTARSNNFPAPNEYNVRKVKCSSLKKKIVPKRLPQTKRIPLLQYESPGPNAYLDPRTALDYLVKPSCVKELNAFLFNAPRFRKHGSDLKVSPNSYTIPTFLENRCKQVSPYAIRNTAFNTSVPKKLYYLPPDYPPIKKRKKCKCSEIPGAPDPPGPKPKPTSSFSSTTKRFKASVAGYDASAASYNVTKCMVYLKTKTSFRRPKKIQYSTIPKFCRVRQDLAVLGNEKLIRGRAENPPSCNTCGNTKGSLALAPRFRGLKSDSPGPQYLLHPAIASCATNRTFNVTLRSPETRTAMQNFRLKLKGLHKTEKPFSKYNQHEAKERKVQHLNLSYKS
ncbi:hypothetical protein RUM44_003395 [Polyplax serrata]|uniref:Uncharacterized protein n=1 Tax=Polyplax serrata TaxID=468196 RepID=A0ABR1AGA9_POLSC